MSATWSAVKIRTGRSASIRFGRLSRFVHRHFENATQFRVHQLFGSNISPLYKKIRKCTFSNKQNELKDTTVVLTNCSYDSYSSGTTRLCTMNLCLFFSVGSKVNGCKQTTGKMKCRLVTVNIRKKIFFWKFIWSQIHTGYFNGRCGSEKTTIGSHTILLRRCSFNFEQNRLVRWIRQAHMWCYGLIEWSWNRDDIVLAQ